MPAGGGLTAISGRDGEADYARGTLAHIVNRPGPIVPLYAIIFAGVTQAES